MNNEVNTINNQVKPKKKSYSIFILALGLLLLVGGVVFYMVNNDDKSNDTKKPDSEEKEEKTLRKILPSELNDETSKEIIQFLLEKEEPDETWNVEGATLMATDDSFTEFLVNIELSKKIQEGSWYRQTVIKYENETWTIELPLWSNGAKDVSKYSNHFGVGE